MAATTRTEPAPIDSHPERTVTICTDGDRELWRSYSVKPDPERANRQANDDGLRASMVDMKAVIDSPTASPAEKRVARAIRRLCKAQLGDYSAAD